jgi:excisionase family DNA binding protein
MTDKHKAPDLLKLSEAALALRCSAPTVRRLITEGELRGYRLGSHGTESLRVARPDLENFLKRNQVTT